MFHVMMVCTGNICRSPMAAGLLAHDMPDNLKKRVAVSSAGTHALQGHNAHEYAIEAMAQIGIDIRTHRARQLTRDITRSADLVLTMETNQLAFAIQTSGPHNVGSRLLTEFDHQCTTADIHDPYNEPLQAYQDCIQTLRPCINGLILWLGNNI